MKLGGVLSDALDGFRWSKRTMSEAEKVVKVGRLTQQQGLES